MTSPAAATAAAGDGRGDAVELRGLQVRFGDSTVLHDLSLSVQRGECLALLGPSGSGKSTALNCVAGFVRPTAGQVLIDGRDVTSLPPAKRGIGFVVQSYALFPHMTVRDNIAFGLKVRKVGSLESGQRIEEVARLVGMDAYLDRKPAQLSGGQQQRVAMARALAIRPDVLLLDEPMSALDTRLRETMLDELKRLRAELPDVAMLVVTHDQGEAMALADRVAILRDGRCEAWDTVESLFYDPPTAYTATFLGSAGVLPALVVQQAGTDAVVDVLGARVAARAPRGAVAGDSAVAIRPWHWEIAPSTASGDDWLTGRVGTDQWRGSLHRYQVHLDGHGEPVPVDIQDGSVRPATGEVIRLRPRPGGPVLVPALSPR